MKILSNLQSEYKDLQDKYSSKLTTEIKKNLNEGIRKSIPKIDDEEEYHYDKMNRKVYTHHQKQLGDEKDEFEYATSWKRAFSQIYRKFTWIISF